MKSWNLLCMYSGIWTWVVEDKGMCTCKGRGWWDCKGHARDNSVTCSTTAKLSSWSESVQRDGNSSISHGKVEQMLNASSSAAAIMPEQEEWDPATPKKKKNQNFSCECTHFRAARKHRTNCQRHNKKLHCGPQLPMWKPGTMDAHWKKTNEWKQRQSSCILNWTEFSRRTADYLQFKICVEWRKCRKMRWRNLQTELSNFDPAHNMCEKKKKTQTKPCQFSSGEWDWN